MCVCVHVCVSVGAQAPFLHLLAMLQKHLAESGNLIGVHRHHVPHRHMVHVQKNLVSD